MARASFGQRIVETVDAMAKYQFRMIMNETRTVRKDDGFLPVIQHLMTVSPIQGIREEKNDSAAPMHQSKQASLQVKEQPRALVSVAPYSTRRARKREERKRLKEVPIAEVSAVSLSDVPMQPKQPPQAPNFRATSRMTMMQLQYASSRNLSCVLEEKDGDEHISSTTDKIEENDAGMNRDKVVNILEEEGRTVEKDSDHGEELVDKATTGNDATVGNIIDEVAYQIEAEIPKEILTGVQ